LPITGVRLLRLNLEQGVYQAIHILG